MNNRCNIINVDNLKEMRERLDLEVELLLEKFNNSYTKIKRANKSIEELLEEQRVLELKADKLLQGIYKK